MMKIVSRHEMDDDIPDLGELAHAGLGFLEPASQHAFYGRADESGLA